MNNAVDLVFTTKDVMQIIGFLGFLFVQWHYLNKKIDNKADWEDIRNGFITKKEFKTSKENEREIEIMKQTAIDDKLKSFDSHIEKLHEAVKEVRDLLLEKSSNK